VFFEHVIRDNLDAGRPDRIGLVFDRRLKTRGPRPTPGWFRTRVITQGVTPSLYIDYKHTAIKQYHKEGRALRTETTINDTRDFGIGKRLTNLPALREVGFSANRRLLSVQRLSHNPIRAAEAFTAVHDPIITADGHRIAGLRLGDRRAHARAELLFYHQLDPLLPGAELRADQWAALWSDLVELMDDGVRRGRIDTVRPEHDPIRTGRAPRQDRHRGEVYVYRRAGAPCLV
jgi:formamidopyrimidine-DNA glycosylase